MIKKITLSFALIILLPTSAYCFDLYVHSIKAPLYAAPSVGSRKLLQLQRGQKIIGIKENKGWYAVTFGQTQGWIYKLMARKTPPLDSSDLYGKQVDQLADKARRRPSAFTTTAAARGLKEKRKRFASKYTHDYAALEKMESIEISNEEATRFLMEGVSNE